MTSKPEYSVFTLDLSSAGSVTFSGEFGLFRFLRAEDASGVEQPGALVEASVLGVATDDFFPLTAPNAVLAAPGVIKRIKLKWAAQTGVTVAKFVASYSRDHMDVVGQPRATLVVGDLASTFTDQSMNVGTTATEMLSANSNRTRALIQAGLKPLYLGPDNTVANTDALATIPAGGALEILHQGAVWGRRAGGTVLARVYEETR